MSRGIATVVRVPLSMLALASGVSLAVAAVPPAARADGTQGMGRAQAAILPGPLTIPECSPLTVGDVAPRGYYSFSLSCRVVDATGSGNGWRVFFTASDGSDAASGRLSPRSGAGPHAPFPSALAEVTGVTQQGVAGQMALATGAVTYPVPLFPDAPAAVFDAAANSGMGQLLLAIDGRISQQRYVRTGAPALTISIVAGP